MEKVSMPYKKRNFSVNLVIDVQEINLERESCNLELSQISDLVVGIDLKDDYLGSNSGKFA